MSNSSSYPMSSVWPNIFCIVVEFALIYSWHHGLYANFLVVLWTWSVAGSFNRQIVLEIVIASLDCLCEKVSPKRASECFWFTWIVCELPWKWCCEMNLRVSLPNFFALQHHRASGIQLGSPTRSSPSTVSSLACLMEGIPKNKRWHSGQI